MLQNINEARRRKPSSSVLMITESISCGERDAFAKVRVVEARPYWNLGGRCLRAQRDPRRRRATTSPGPDFRSLPLHPVRDETLRVSPSIQSATRALAFTDRFAHPRRLDLVALAAPLVGGLEFARSSTSTNWRPATSIAHPSALPYFFDPCAWGRTPSRAGRDTGRGACSRAA